MKKALFAIPLLALAGAFAAPLAAAPPTDLILATTTSTADTGLLDEILPSFEKANGIKVKVIAVGTGEAIAMGRRGDADVLLVHNRSAEDEFMKEGFGSLRLDVMHNDFLLVGPPSDPAKARGLAAVAAFERIGKTKGAIFVSRGDKSGTHSKELSIWKKVGLEPAKGEATYLETGQGMGETIRVVSEKQAYTLIDRGTWLATKGTLQLDVISEKEPSLYNPYGVIVVSAKKLPKVKEKEAELFARWIASPETQKRIGAFGVTKFGQSLFIPDAAPKPAATTAPAPAGKDGHR
jgi:tungstate transport system substrate-binding protein